MAKKRDLKRSINYACSELFAEGVSLYLTTDKEEIPQIDSVLTAVLKMHSDFVRRVSHPEPGMPAKKYYRCIINDFNKTVVELIEQLQAIG